MAEPAISAQTPAAIRYLFISDSLSVSGRLLAVVNKVELQLDVIGHQRRIAPFALANSVLQTLDRQHAVEDLRGAVLAVLHRQHDVRALAADRQRAGDRVAAIGARLDRGGHKARAREVLRAEPVLAGTPRV